MRPHILTTVIVVSFPATAFAEEFPQGPDIDEVFAEYNNSDSPGCSMAVYEDGQIAYARGYGMANLEYGIENGPDTVFRIASVSKQFTAMAIALLAEEGTISLDDDIRDYFPAMADYSEPVTIRQLVHHTSGVRDYLTLAGLADWTEGYSVDEAVGIVERQKELNFVPGTEFLYSNSGYFLLALIVERATGQSLRDWADENMFQPLGMTNTHFHDDHTHIVKKRADGYAPRDNGAYAISMTTLDIVGDGGIFTTVSDLLNWEGNFYDNRLGKGGPELIELVETPGDLANGESTGYAFGLGIGEYAGRREVSHGGAFVGFRAELVRYPEHHLSVAVLCNRADANPGGLARRVSGILLGETGEGNEQSGENEPQVPAPAIEVSVTDLETYVGDYMSAESYTVRSVVLDGDALFYVRGAGNRTKLDPTGAGQFVLADSPTVNVRFESVDERSQEMILEVEGEEPSYFDRLQRVAPSAEDLADYAGSYFSEELAYTLTLAVQDDVLVANRRNGVAPLQPLETDMFVSEAGVVLIFERNGQDSVTGLLQQAGRVRNINYVRQ